MAYARTTEKMVAQASTSISSHTELSNDDPLAIFSFTLLRLMKLDGNGQEGSMVFDFMQFEGPLEEQAREFVAKGISRGIEKLVTRWRARNLLAQIGHSKKFATCWNL